MRSNVKNGKNAKKEIRKKQNENGIILSVGMIVKNEEEHLDNCLSALKEKLLDHIPSELIIVDTGSTDRTKEIALKYTDKVFDFEWIDDFAAARNCGLKRAKGKWFMFIDADEYLHENADEMVKFFSIPELYEKYNSASYYIVGIRGGRTSNRFLASRLVKLTPDVEFHDKIHEWIPQPNPHGMFSTVFYHYGYDYKNKDEMYKKADRNLIPLFEEYKKNPDDIRIISHICDMITGSRNYPKYEDQVVYYDDLMNLARKYPKANYSVGAYQKSLNFFLMHEKYDRAQELIDEFFGNDDYFNDVTRIAMCYYSIMLYMGENDYHDYEKALKYVNMYFEDLERFDNGKLDTVVLRSDSIIGIEKEDREQVRLNGAICSHNLGKFEEALDYLDKLTLDDMGFPHLRIFLNVVRDLIRETKNYSHAATCYKKIQSLGDDDKTGLILFLLQQYYFEHKSEREDFVKAMIDSGVKGKYIDLMKLVRDDSKGKDISKPLQKFIDSIDRWDDGYTEAIYLGMKHGCDLTSVVEKSSSKLIRTNLQLLSEAHPVEYCKTVIDYYDIDEFSTSIKKLLWLVTAFEVGVSCSNEIVEDEDKSVFFDTFVCALSDYVMNIYNPDLLNQEDADVLPELHRFGYYMTLAFTAKDEGNSVVYVRMLKEALRLCEPMKDVVSYYLAELEKELK